MTCFRPKVQVGSSTFHFEENERECFFVHYVLVHCVCLHSEIFKEVIRFDKGFKHEACHISSQYW